MVRPRSFLRITVRGNGQRKEKAAVMVLIGKYWLFCDRF